MNKKTVAILFGGNSTEYEVSLQSAYSVIEAIDRTQYHVLLIGITRDGQWFLYEGETSHILDDTWSKSNACTSVMLSPEPKDHGILLRNSPDAQVIRLDAVFPVLHGKNGEDGTVQGLLQMAGIPRVGCGLLSSAICMDKDIAHRLVRAEGVAVPKSTVLFAYPTEEEFSVIDSNFHYPVFVKPANAGSSYGITQVFHKEELPGAVQNAFLHDHKVIVEETIDGFEIGCAIMGDVDLIVGELDEIELKQGFFDYTEKYSLITSKIHMPARIDAKIKNEILITARLIYRTLGCKGFARVDMFLTPYREIVFNEVNTIPGFTSHSRYPNMFKGIGWSFSQIIATLLEQTFQESES
ncbi:MAG: D-alanine--D-serine ligase VanG [Lachnospiraceae bacterium]|nr:D-alanine--D-serine ligase VanG [Lachnospiraceae bacterium]